MKIDPLLQICLLVLFCSYLVTSCDLPSPAPTARTKSQLKHTLLVVRVLESENNLSIGAQLANINPGKALQEKWERLLLENKLKLDIDDRILGELCRDDFDNLFNVEYKTNVVNQPHSGDLIKIPHDVLIWSSGPNKVNEYGKGDDIFLLMNEWPKDNQ